MWLFTKRGLLSVTRSPRDPSKIQVRARSRRTIEYAWETLDAEGEYPDIIETDDSDYRYRFLISPGEWSRLASVLADDVDYGNFKGLIHESARTDREKIYGMVLHQVWQAGMSLDDGGR